MRPTTTSSVRGDEHVAFAEAAAREPVGQQQHAGKRVDGGAPAHRRLRRSAAAGQLDQPGVGPASVDDQQALQDEPEQAAGACGDQQVRSRPAEHGAEAQQQRQCQWPQPWHARKQGRRREAVVQAVPRHREQRRGTDGNPDERKAWRPLHVAACW